MTALFQMRDLCCDKCTHSKDKPCPDFAACLTEGPVCHHDVACQAKRKDFFAGVLHEVNVKPVVYVGTGTCGLGAGAAKTLVAVREEFAKRGVDAEFVEVGCIGFCVAEPMLDVQMPGRARVCYRNVTHDQVASVVEAALSNKPVSHPLVLGQFRSKQSGASYSDVAFLDEHPFFKPQVRWVLENCGLIDPASVASYIARGGYKGFGAVLKQKTPPEVCDQVEKSGLRGRGGGGFSTGKKWKMAQETPSIQKYFVCNADEGDPGAFMDRAVIEGDPHRLLEGLAIASYAIGASVAYIYIRAEYPLAIARLKTAIADAEALGLLGTNILDSGFNLRVIIKKGAGAFVCGEETALMHSIEGKRGMPRPRPPYPTTSGLFGKPTVINNVETLANIPLVIRLGVEGFSAVGTKTSKGTKVFALSGKVANTGLVEVTMGTSIRDIIFEIGGGIPNGKKFKAVQIGGPSGGCLPQSEVGIAIDYESLLAAGAMMGSGGMVVMDEDTCMVDLAKYFMEFIQRESCGKCIPCREGTKQLLSIFEQITRSRRSEKGNDALRRMQSIMNIRELAKVIKDTSLCGLGNSAPNPVLSTLRWFEEEYAAHVYERRCPAKACKSLLTYSIDESKCVGCTLCKKKCPSEAIMGSVKAPHYIINDKCIGCGSCVAVCPKQAIAFS